MVLLDLKIGLNWIYSWTYWYGKLNIMTDLHALTFGIDRDTEQPLYLQIKYQLIRQIEHGILPAGNRLPPTRELADHLGIARISVVNAYDELKEEGYINSYVGRGTYVADRSELTHSARNYEGQSADVQRQLNALRDMMRLGEHPDVFNFGRGAPPDTFLPVDLIRDAINDVLSRDGSAAIAYEDAEGYLPLRQSIAALLRPQGIETSADNILITGGCQQALDLAVQALLEPGDVMLTGAPTYTGILNIARARKITVIGVPVDEHGMQVDVLETLIDQHNPRLIYTAPSFHNPTGTVMPLNHRRQVINLAERYQIPVLEDGVYEELTYNGQLPVSLKALDESGLVLYASSFSKILLPGMRIGYLVTGERLQRRLTQVKQAADVCTPALNQRAMHAAIESGTFQMHLARVRSACFERRQAMLTALEDYFPEAQFYPPEGGLYLWVSLPQGGPTATELYLHTVRPREQHRVGAAFAPGPLFYPDGQGAYQLRLNMVTHPADSIHEGIAALGSGWQELVHSTTHSRQSTTAPLL